LSEQEIEIEIKKLPEDLKREIWDYIEFVSKKYQERIKNPSGFRFDWEGGLSDFKNEFNSVELQHQAMNWR
jgi:hypothetical protein